ncbi:MAG: UDP-N-acetylmuramoyl-tripeptide--D-alanyl-D-alanine ligase, partial [Anaerotignum sp.]|nr:UDP-N-acetylmuramoyl-tripeptide--D-alanyl-D-alanine ligase [Anaerotignum sp.]
LTMFRIEDHHEAAVIEMGMNHFGELDRIATAVRPHIGVISNVGVAHIGFLGSREGILKAKCEMLDHLEQDGVAILNADNDMLQTLEGKLPHAIKWFGVENKRDFYADEIEVIGLEQTKCTLHTPIGSVSVVIPVPGEHMVLNALSAAAVGVELGLTLEQIKAGIDNFVPTKKRMTLMKDVNGITILNDSYNANPVSMKSALDVLSNAEGRKVAVLGTMGELEDYAPAMHKEVGAYAAEKGTDVLICIGKWNDCMEAGAKEGGMTEVYRYETQEEFWENGLSLIKKGDNVLVKASLSTGLSRTVDKLQGVN